MKKSEKIKADLKKKSKEELVNLLCSNVNAGSNYIDAVHKERVDDMSKEVVIEQLTIAEIAVREAIDRCNERDQKLHNKNIEIDVLERLLARAIKDEL